MKTLSKTIGARSFDLIVDDWGHTMMQQQNVLGTYWSQVNPGGAFIMEDLHTLVLDKFQTPQWQKNTVEWFHDSTKHPASVPRANLRRFDHKSQ